MVSVKISNVKQNRLRLGLDVNTVQQASENLWMEEAVFLFLNVIADSIEMPVETVLPVHNTKFFQLMEQDVWQSFAGQIKERLLLDYVLPVLHVLKFPLIN